MSGCRPVNVSPLATADVTNGDEAMDFNGHRYLGNFHKTLPHDEFGVVAPNDYETFRDICADPKGDFERVPLGAFMPAPPRLPPKTNTAKLISPQSGRATEILGPDPCETHMVPPPGVLSDSTAAEMTELYWMALHRDTSLDLLLVHANVKEALTDLTHAFTRALAADTPQTGGLRIGTDLPLGDDGKLNLTARTLYRVGLCDEDKGPLVSQFFLNDFAYGAQQIRPLQYAYKPGKDWLIARGDWLRAQNSGLDFDGDDYPHDNDFGASSGKRSEFYETDEHGHPLRFRIRTMRDIARFVNRDALHQAYFNAALQLLNWNAPLDDGNPYKTKMPNDPPRHYARQTAFATLGGPNLLALVSEVASRALKVVWRQKWLVHRRLRPEAYGGLMEMQKLAGQAYGLPDWVFETRAAQAIFDANETYFLPLAFSAGSPAHPSYGAGHACVAGACVTILKAWFDESQSITSLYANAPTIDPRERLLIRQPSKSIDASGLLPRYTGHDAASMTLLGELNKLAGNVALGRSMGGVHWRSDNTRSLRLGEQVSTIILKRLWKTYAERPLSFSYTNFDGNAVHIADEVAVANDAKLEAFYGKF